MSYTSTSIPKPKNWQDFERQIRDLLECVLEDPNTQINGRSGQAQNGVDIFGNRKSNNNLVGIQCKKKYEDKVTDKELRCEVEKAKDFRPYLDEFILTTTYPRDQAIQETARIINKELSITDHPFHVSVWGWDDIEENVIKYEKAMRSFDPAYNPFTDKFGEKVMLELQEVKHLFFQSPMHPSYTTQGINVKNDEENTQLHGEITLLQRLIDDGHVRAALSQINRLKEDKWDKANKSERYRILVCTASAKLKLGEKEDAANLLINAYSECPEHKNAKNNLATGYLLKRDSNKAVDLAREILQQNDKDERSAGILIQALIDDASCQNPLNDIPEELHESEDVLTSLILFYRSRGNYEWHKLAAYAAKKYEKSRILKLFSAEAILDDLTMDSHGAFLGSKSDKFDQDVFNNAVEILYSEAHDAIVNGYPIESSVAHNAALALRLADDNIRAKEILDTSIKQNPKDDNLRLQRALISYLENEPLQAIDVLNKESTNPEVIGLYASSLLAIGKVNEAVYQYDKLSDDLLPEHVKMGKITTKLRQLVERGEKQLAIDTIEKYISEDRINISYRCIQIMLLHNLGRDQDANKALDGANMLIDSKTNFSVRLELSIEARRLRRFDVIVDLLKGYVALDRESESLHILLAASINSELYVTAKYILDTIPPKYREDCWYQKADIIFALNTGNIKADEKLDKYLKQYPKDLEMILTRIGTWKRDNRDADISKLLQLIDLTDIKGKAEDRIQLASIICDNGESLKGLKYAYSVLMDNWDNPQAHLAYHGLIFSNGDAKPLIPLVDVVDENTVVNLNVDGAERRYRIERKKYRFFEDERLSPDNDLAIILIGKKVGESFKINEYSHFGSVKIIWIKSVYLDALHISLEQFNDRFPRADGLLRFTFNPEAEDPLKDIKKVIKARAEMDLKVLEEYKTKCFALTFIAKMIGRDVIDVLNGLLPLGIKFNSCHGNLNELNTSVSEIGKYVGKGCVLDVITIWLINKLEIEDVITDVFRNVATTQSVVTFLTSKAIEARKLSPKVNGFLAWHNGEFSYKEYSKEYLEQSVNEIEKVASWAKSLNIVPAMPMKDLSIEARSYIETFSHAACDPAIAAEGNDILLISEDLGYRVWSESYLKVKSVWLQPLLTYARDSGFITTDRYCSIINQLVFNGHTYVSLDPICLIYQCRKDNFSMTKEVASLLNMVGGVNADIRNNSIVLANFIDFVVYECNDNLKCLRIISEVFDSFSKGRHEDLRELIYLIALQVRTGKTKTNEHALRWLIGHSFGAPWFSDLLDRCN